MNKKDIKGCPECTHSVSKDYYSIYYIQVSDDRISDIEFKFHIPYTIGKDFLGSPNQLTAVEHEEPDGIFRFGRLPQGKENIVYRKEDVVRYIKDATDKCLLYHKGT